MNLEKWGGRGLPPEAARVFEPDPARPELSAADIARLLGKRRPAIHYQVKYLAELGLLEPAGKRGSGRREQVLFRTPGRPMGVVFRRGDPDNVRLTIAYVKSLLQRARRVISKAFESPRVRTRGERRNTHATQITCRLDGEQLKAVNRCIEELRSLCSPETLEADGELFLVTVTLSPIE